MKNFINIKQSDGTYKGLPLIAGKSAYQLAVEDGFKGTLSEWLADLKSTAIITGTDLPDPNDGRIGDLYMQLPLDDGIGYISFYKKDTDTTWSKIGNIINEDDSIIKMMIVQTSEELNNIDITKIPDGSMCYVDELENYFYLSNNEWVILKNNTLTVVDEYNDLNELSQSTNITPGTMVFVKSENAYYHYDTNNNWIENRTFVISDEEPTDTNIIWIPKDEVQAKFENNITFKDIQAAFKAYNAQIKLLNDKITSLQNEIKQLRDKDFLSSIIKDEDTVFEKNPNFIMEKEGELMRVPFSRTRANVQNKKELVLTGNDNKDYSIRIINKQIRLYYDGFPVVEENNTETNTDIDNQ